MSLQVSAAGSRGTLTAHSPSSLGVPLASTHGQADAGAAAENTFTEAGVGHNQTLPPGHPRFGAGVGHNQTLPPGHPRFGEVRLTEEQRRLIRHRRNLEARRVEKANLLALQRERERIRIEAGAAAEWIEAAANDRGMFAGRCYVCGVGCGHTYCQEHVFAADQLCVPYRKDDPK